ncbi:MAG: glycine zipper domain-containing protein [Candidatus Brocadiales bacterium]
MKKFHLAMLACILGITLAGAGCAASKTQKGAGIGAGAGAATGAVIGATVGAPGVGAAIGAGAGGTVGALVGDVLEKKDEDKREKEEITKQLEAVEAGKQ